MKMNKFISISIICILAVLSVSASRKANTYEITIDGREYAVGIDGSLIGKVSGSSPNNARFVTCENHAGNGFFWVDTSCGAVWWASPQETKWIYYGSPATPQGRVGRYIPYENKGGAGLYILDTDQGQGWWTNGEQWKEMGLPQKKASSSNR